jgi:DNA-binding GntR family transcriptional regulator
VARSTPGSPIGGTASERAYAHVKEEILSGGLEGGELISEGEIADDLAMSRTPVREAFLRLQAEGWMRLYPKRGAAITPIRPQEADEVMQARVLIETRAVAVIGGDQQRASELVAELNDIIERQRRAIVDHDLAAFIDADADLHTAIVLAAGNSLLIDFYIGLRDRQRRMTRESLRREGERESLQRQRLILDQHRRLADLITAGDPAAFETELARHLDETHRR